VLDALRVLVRLEKRGLVGDRVMSNTTTSAQ